MAGGRADIGLAARWPFVGRTEELATFPAVLADSSRRGMLVCGPPGVGKTRLAEAFLAVAAGAGREVGRATGSAAAAQIPLGALAHLLPAEVGRDRSDPVALFGAVSAAFRSGGDAPFVLLADDLHLLDVTSLTLLTQLVDAAAVFLVGTVRTGEPVPDAVTALWRGDRAARIDLTELSRAGVAELLCAVLGGPVEAATVADVYAVGRGNVLFVRELVFGALAAGRLVAERGVWRLAGPLVSTAPLVELVEENLRTVVPAGRRALDLLAAVGPVGATELAAVVGLPCLEELERAGLVTVRPDGRRHEVALGHPMYGEVLRAQLPMLTLRRLLLEHADRVQATGARRRGDPLRIATWRLDAEGRADPDLLLAATRLARYGHDFRGVRRLARAALATRTTVEARLLLGESLYELGSFAEAEQVLAAAATAATEDRDLVPVAATRVRNLTWGMLQPAHALAVSRAARAQIADPDGRCELLAVEARVQLHAGAPFEALRTLEPLADHPELRIRVLRAVPYATALVLTGRCEAGLAAARDGYREHTLLGDQLAIVHPSAHLVTEVHALAEAGRLAEATARATSGLELAVRDRSTIGRIWFAYHLGRCALLAGRVRTAGRWFGESAALCRAYGYAWPRRLALSGLAAAAGATGNAAAAQQAVAEAAGVGDIGYLRYEQELGAAWAAAAGADPPRALALLRPAAEQAAATGQHSSAAWLLHDIARLGDPAGVRDRLAALAARCEGGLAAAYAAHAHAAAAGDPDGLAATARQFERLGALLYAAEAAVSAGRAYRRRGDLRAAARLDAHAAALSRLCEGARTPSLVAESAVVPLTRREREVALLASRGGTSKEIASALHLSARTVDNHLQNAYAKLGVTGRGELAAALSVPG